MKYNNGTIIKCKNHSYKIIHQRGKGNYGIVYKAERLSDSKIVALKVPSEKNSQDIYYSEKEFNKIKEKMLIEINFLKAIRNESEKNHIITLLDWNDDDINNLVMAIPLCDEPLGNFQRSAGQRHKFTISQLLSWIEQILTALSFMQKHNLSIHRDIKIDNILVKDKKAYLIDFGTKKEIEEEITKKGTCSIAGTREWGAPEQFIPMCVDKPDKPKYDLTPKADIYPLGLIIFALMTIKGTLPNAHKIIKEKTDDKGRCRSDFVEYFQKLGGLDDKEVEYLKKCTEELAENEKIPFIKEFVDEFTNFVIQLLNPVIKNRPDAEQAIQKLNDVKARLNPVITALNVECPDKVELESAYKIIISPEGNWIPSLDIWLKIKIDNNPVQITDSNIKNINPNSWELIMPGFTKTGSHILEIQAQGFNQQYITTIDAYATPQILWNLKKYTKALTHINDPNYNNWLNQIENESKKSSEKRDKWINILNKVIKKISVLEKPEICILCARLLSEKYNISIIRNEVSKVNEIETNKNYSVQNEKKNEKYNISNQENNDNKETSKNKTPIKSKKKSKIIIALLSWISMYIFITLLLIFISNKIYYSTLDKEIKSLVDSNFRPLKYINNKFVDNHDGTISDMATGLMWQKAGSDDFLSFSEAISYIDKINKEKFADYNDWRLPTIEEIISLIEKNKNQKNDLYISELFDKQQWWCWSGSRWRVNFVSGKVNWLNVFNLYVRGVRAR